MKLFPGLPKDLAALSNEEIEALISEYTGVFLKVKARDAETMGDLLMPEALEQARAAKDDLTTLREEITTRAEVEATFDDELEALAVEAGVSAEAAVDDVAGEVAADEAEDVVEVAEAITETPEAAEVKGDVEVVAEEVADAPAEAIAASALPAARPRLPRASSSRLPRADRTGTPIVASAGLEGFAPSQELDRMQLAEAMIRKLRQGNAVPRGFRDDVVIASAQYGDLFPDELRLLGDARDTEKISAMIEARRSWDGITASGGLCAPVTPYYELMNVAVALRPVRDAMANFNAVRGGLQFAAPPVIGDITTGVGIKTAAQDAAGGTTAQKTCQVVDCPDFSTVQLSMIYHCLQFGNLNARAFPEMIADYNDLVMAAHARVAETALLNAVAAASTAVAHGPTYGAVSTIITGWLEAAAGMRSRLRMSPDARFRVLAPEWLPDVLAADLVNSQFIRFEYAREDIERLLGRYGVNVTWYLDGASGAGQVYGAQTAGALLAFPTTAKAYIYPEGSFLFLDGGTLDLGIVRDSELNESNNFQIFGETFEATAFVGPESLALTSTICPSGTTGPTATAITC